MHFTMSSCNLRDSTEAQQCCRLKSNLGSSGPSSGGGGGGADMTSINSWWLINILSKRRADCACLLVTWSPVARLLAAPALWRQKGCWMMLKELCVTTKKNSDCQLSHFGCLECVLNMLGCLTWSVHRRVMQFILACTLLFRDPIA